jgi:trehalose 6-phosphate phosphatase
VEHLFHAWPFFLDAVAAVSHVLLLSDYDGTLTPIVPRPEQALLSPAVGEKLRTLAGRPDFSVGIVSGRSLAETRDIVGLEGIYYAGNHGLEIQGPGIDFVSPPAERAREQMKELAAKLADGLQNIAGVIVQDKGLSLSVHYRLVKAESEKEVARVVRGITAPSVKAGKIRLFTGKKVWEVRPPIDWDKGKAVEAIRREIMKRLEIKRPLTVYLGDDLTDEDAFKALHRPEGWGIYVGGNNPKSMAACYLDSVTEVEEFLGRLVEIKSD